MALPVLEKVWQFNINNYVRADYFVVVQSRSCIFLIKNALIGFVSSPWTVWGSCDGGGGFGNGDSVDRWVNINDLIWAAVGSNHSWIVLSQSGLGGNASICIDLSNTNNYVLTLIMSPSAGFGVINGGADGTAISRPTATDEVVLINNTNWGVSSSIGVRHVVHVLQSTDGKCTRILICQSAITGQGFWMIEKPSSAIAAWTPLVLGNASGSTSLPQLTRSTQSNIATPVGLAKIGADTVSMTMVYETYYDATAIIPVNGIPDDQNDENPFIGIGLYCTTAGHRGRKARLVDIWFNANPGSGYLHGQPFPDDGSYQFVNIGQFIFPWNGTAKVALA